MFKNRFASAILMAATTFGTVSSGMAQKPAAEQQPGLGGPVIAGVLTAVVLAGGLKGFYDVISKQYG